MPESRQRSSADVDGIPVEGSERQAPQMPRDGDGVAVDVSGPRDMGRAVVDLL